MNKITKMLGIFVWGSILLASNVYADFQMRINNNSKDDYILSQGGSNCSGLKDYTVPIKIKVDDQIGLPFVVLRTFSCAFQSTYTYLYFTNTRTENKTQIEFSKGSGSPILTINDDPNEAFSTSGYDGINID